MIKLTVGSKEIESARLNDNELGSLGGDIESNQPDIKVKIKDSSLTIKLAARKTLDNNIIVYDHPVIDIILIPFKNKIITLPKEGKRDVYPIQKAYLDFLQKKGALVLGTIQGGNVMSSLEAFYPYNGEINTLQVLLLLTKIFIDQEIDNYYRSEDYQEEVEDMYVDPEENTELGDIEHKAEKGSIDSYKMPYGLVYRI